LSLSLWSNLSVVEGQGFFPPQVHLLMGQTRVNYKNDQFLRIHFLNGCSCSLYQHTYFQKIEITYRILSSYSIKLVGPIHILFFGKESVKVYEIFCSCIHSALFAIQKMNNIWNKYLKHLVAVECFHILAW